MDPYILLDIARDLIGSELTHFIKSMDLIDEHFMLKIIFNQGSQLYIRYNEYNEYSYQFFYSQQQNEYIRYDNFDDRWDVKTRPHHFHNRDKKIENSFMIGDPNHDIPILISKIQDYFTHFNQST